MLCAAMVDSQFCNTMLRDPSQAISLGYQDHTFALTAEERMLVCGIQAQRLEDFASQIQSWVSTNGNGASHNGNGHDILSKVRHKEELFRSP
jgi:hypothetical protein